MVESSNNSATLDGLRFWKCYQVNITAVTVREGPYAIAAETRTSENGNFTVLSHCNDMVLFIYTG